MAIHNCYLIGVLLCKQEALMEARMKIKIQVLPLLSTMGSIIFEFVFSDQMHNNVKTYFLKFHWIKVFFKNKLWILKVEKI